MMLIVDCVMCCLPVAIHVDFMRERTRNNLILPVQTLLQLISMDSESCSQKFTKVGSILRVIMTSMTRILNQSPFSNFEKFNKWRHRSQREPQTFKTENESLLVL